MITTPKDRVEILDYEVNKRGEIKVIILYKIQAPVEAKVTQAVAVKKAPVATTPVKAGTE